MSVQITDVVVLGAGAAGLMCALTAGRRGRRVVVLEHNAEAGRKILISGGGRCNFTHLDTTAANFLSDNPHFAKSALARFTPRDFLAMLEARGIRWHEKAAGQLFCDRAATDILNLLLGECSAAGVRIQTSCEVRAVAGQFEVATTHGTWRAASLVIASGGLSIPKIGATGFGYEIARQYGLGIVPCRPALVPWTFAPAERTRFEGMAGIAAESAVTAGAATFRERLLFTHRGLSGPSVLQASSYWKPGEAVAIDLAPGVDLASELRSLRASGSKLEARTVAARFLTKRLADRWFEGGAGTRAVATLSDREIDGIAAALHQWGFTPAGTEGYEKAEVTAGGVDTAELSSKTLEARKAPGLYFIGEVVDVTGQLGGFNFQWAWASGHAAGQAV